MNKVTINIKQEHLDRGVKYLLNECPIGLAAKEVLKPNMLDTADLQRQPLPKEAIDFMRKWDNGEKVQPMQFSLWVD